MNNPFKSPKTRQAIIGIVKRVGNKTLQVLGWADEMIDGVELYQQCGFASHIPKDAEVVLLPMGGKGKNFVIIAGKDSVGVEVGEGETVVYNQHGVELKLLKDRIEANKAIHAPKIVADEVQDAKGTMEQMRSIYNSHAHANNGASTPSKTMS